MPLLDLSSTVTRLTSGTYAVTRYTQGAYFQGRWLPATPTIFQMKALIYATEPRELLRLPEGLRTHELITVFSTVQCQTANAQTGTDADRISFNGYMYEVEVQDDKSGSGNYFQCFARKVGQ